MPFLWYHNLANLQYQLWKKEDKEMECICLPSSAKIRTAQMQMPLSGSTGKTWADGKMSEILENW